MSPIHTPVSAAPPPATTPHHGALYVTNFTAGLTGADLQELIGKLLEVTGVHEPGPTATGMKRAFAMVRVTAADTAAVAACARKLNNCQWKGSRLTVEVAAPSYQVRLAAERQAAQDSAQALQQLMAEQASQVMPAFDPTEKKGVMRLLRIPKQHAFVASDAALTAPAALKIKRGRVMLPVLSLGKRTVFQEAEDGSFQSLAAGGGAGGRKLHTPEPEVGEEAAAPAASSRAATAVSCSSGGRKGFGTLLDTSSKINPNQMDNLDPRLPYHQTREATGLGRDDCCVEWDDSDRSGGSRKSLADPVRMSQSEFSSGQQDSDEEERYLAAHEEPARGHQQGSRLSSTRGLNDDSSDEDEHVPSCTAAELEPEALLGERQRALAMLAHIQGHGLAPGADPDAAASAEGGAPSQQQQRLNKRGWEAVRETAALRFDPSAEDGGASFEMDAEEKQALLRRVKERDQLRAARLGFDKFGHEVGASGAADTPKEVGHANLGELKGIFSKGEAGGVWFGDDGGLGLEVQKAGEKGLDDIFLAAEKHGLDVRVSSEPSAAMTFSFFDEAPADAETETAAGVAAPQGPPSGSENFALARTLSGATVLGVVDRDEEEERENQDPNHWTASMGAAGFCAQARGFCRPASATDEQLRQQWQEQRDKGVVDIKRRVHDMRRKNKRLGVSHGKQGGGRSGGVSVSAGEGARGGGGAGIAGRKRGGRRGQGGKNRH